MGPSFVHILSEVSMASCSLGAINVRLPELDFGITRFSNLQRRNGTISCLGRRQLQYSGVAISHKSKFSLHCGPSLETDSADKEDSCKDAKQPGLSSQLIPNPTEIESLVTDICDTSIAEFELKLGGFRLYVTRDLTEKFKPPSPSASATVPAPASSSPAPVNESSPPKLADSNGSVSSTSLAIMKTGSSSGGIQSFIDRAADEGLMTLQSPRVGFFRRCRTIKGKKTPPACKEKQIVKEGQVLCYIEQLGGELPIESDVSGEVIKILREDGEPVGYGDALIAILPSFPGIKKLQ